jgi:NodT family efflux transporter outer membrane factor (OMF) lipoprotein
MRPGILLGLAVMAGVLAGCTVGPDYRAPSASELDAPAAWHAKVHAEGQHMRRVQWWDRFDDPVLRKLIAAAEATSPTVDLAAARVREARALLDAARAPFLPSLTGAAAWTRSNGGGSIPGVPGSGTPQTQSSGTLSLLWDLDLFGRTRRSVEGSEARVAAIEADFVDARVALATAVALAYSQRRQCEVLEEQDEVDLKSRIETHRLTSDKVNAGFSAPADALRTEASVAEGTATLQDVRGQCAQLVNQLVALTGTPYVDVEALLATGRSAIPQPPPAPIAEIPADALRQRPDVIASERALAAASADIGVAVANRYPSIQLLGSIGRSRLRIGDRSGSTDTWSIGPSLSLPIFDAGLGAAQVTAARARYDQALAAYRQKVRDAVQDVEDSLVRTDVALDRERNAALADARYQAYFAAKDAQYRHGAASLLDLEDARRLTVLSRLSLASAQLERARSWISLYRSVGGGWQDYAPATLSSQDRP